MEKTYEEIVSDDFVKTPLVSIRVLAYNHEKYISQCLDSLVCQVCDFGYEIVIGEDCSTDGTLEICKAYQKKYPDRVRIIHNRKNLGLMDNFLQINSLLRGDYIACCAGDDYWVDMDKLQKQVAILKQKPCASAVITNKQIVDDDGNVLCRECIIVPENKEREYSLHDFFSIPNDFSSLTMLYRKLSYDKTVDVYKRLYSTFLEDYTLWICLLTQGNFYFLNDVTAAYRINPTSVTHTQNAVLRWKEDFQIRRNLISVLPKEYHKYLKNDEHAYFKIGMAYRKMQKYPQAMWNFLRAFCCSPTRFVKQIRELLANKKGT